MKNIKTFEDFVGKTNEEAEGGMYKTKLKAIAENAAKLLQKIGDSEDLEAWIQDKITIADHNMEAILGYYDAEKKSKEKPLSVPVQGDMKTGGMLKDEK